MHIVRSSFGGLDCHLAQASPSATPDQVAILCHGFGAPGADLVPLAEETFRLRPELRASTRFVFPEGPLTLEGFGDARAWWPIAVERFATLDLADPAAIAAMTDGVPDGLAKSRRLLMALIECIRQQTGLATARIVLGGFSQGSMLATDVALRLDEAVKALVIFSGAVICRHDWERRAGTRRGLPVLQSHGRQDPLLPYAIAEQLRYLLEQGGLTVDFRPFEGGHTITIEALEAFANLLAR